MSFNQKIVERMQKLHLTKAQLAKAAGIPYTTLDSMLKRDSDQKRMASILRIAEILDTSVEELVLSAQEHPERREVLSSAERELIEAYRTLDLRGKGAVLALVDHERKQVASAALPQDAQEVKKGRRLKVYDLPAAAGSALPLFSEDYTWHQSGEAPAGAHFGVRISGDSMEPMIHDGSIVWIQQQEELSDGQTGIFLLNGEALCKHLNHRDGDCLLCSENPLYAPIAVHEDDDLRVVGRVLL